MSRKKENGCGCAQIPISLILLILGGGYWWFIHLNHFSEIAKLLQLTGNEQTTAPISNPAPTNSESALLN